MSADRRDGASGRRRRWPVALGRLGGAIALGGAFSVALVASVSVHSGTPAFRRVAATIGNAAMAGLFEGDVVVTGVESLVLGPRSTVLAKGVTVTTEGGEPVVVAEDVEATISLLRLLSSLAAGGPPVVEVPTARIRSAEVVIDVDETGVPTIARAFYPRASERRPDTSTGSAGSPSITLPSIVVAHARVRGNAIPPSLDGDADEVNARLTIEGGVARIDLDEARLTLRSPKVPGQRPPVAGLARGALAIDLATSAMSGHVELDGACEQIPIALRGRLDGDVVDVSVEVARVEPGAVRSAFDAPIEVAVELEARAHGKLPALTLDARGRLGEARVTARGELDLREGRPFELEVDVERFDARALGAELATDVSGTLHVDGALASSGGGPVGRFRLATREGVVADEPIPAALIEGRFAEEDVTATLRATDSGVTLTGKITARLPAERASFDLQARSSNLRAIRRARGKIGGAASARLVGEVDLQTKTVKATVAASGERVELSPLSAQKLSANGTLEGPLGAPRLDVDVSADRIRVASGGDEPVEYRAATGRAQLAFTPSPTIIRSSLRVTTADGGEVSASAEGVRLANGVVDARDVRVSGLGEPLALDVRLGEPRWSVRAKSEGVDLRRVGALTGLRGLSLLPEGTRATVDVDVRQEPGGASGHVDVHVATSEGVLAGGAVVAEVHARAVRGALVGSATLSAEGVGHVEIARAELDLPSRIDARSLERMTGVAELRGALDLSHVAAIAGPPVERVAGMASFTARVERRDPGALPAVRATVRTEGLDLALHRGGAPVALSGIDASAHLAWDGRTDDAEVAIMTWDVHGRLAHASAKAKLPLAQFASGKKKLDADAIAGIEVDLLAELPSRHIATLPPFLSVSELRGRVDGSLRVTGPLARPDVVLSGRARGLRGALASARAPSFAPLDGTLEARWDGERAAITFSLDERRRLGFRAPRSSGAPRALASTAPRDEERPPQTTPGHVRGLVILTDLRAADLLRGRSPAELPWAASAEVEVESLALGALPLPHAMAGALSGRARVRDLNRDPAFEANVSVEGFGLRGTNAGKLDVTAGGRDASLFAHASLAEADGSSVVQVASQSLRLKGLEVSWDDEAPTRIDYAVQNGRLALVGPLVRRTIPEIEGRVDGAGSISLDRGTQVFEGGLAVQGARLYVAALGEEISSLEAVARFDRTGTFRIDGATGKMGAGAFRASASGRMKGLEFDSAEAVVVVPRDAIPLSSQAVTFAEATGEVHLSATMSDDRSALLVAVDVPRAHVELPTRTAQALQPLDPDPTVAVGVRRRDGELDTTAVVRGRGGTGRGTTSSSRDILTAKMAVALGDRVQLHGRGLDVLLGGRTHVELADDLSVTGSLDLRGGTIEVHGRRFNVEHGTVTFPEGGTPDNPTIIGAAYWDAPDRTRVWVEFAGPLKTGKLTLRSEPAYTKNEILSVLLFGRPDPNMGLDDASGSGNAAGATAVGTGFLAGDFNRVLSELDPDLDVETDTLSGNRARGKVGHSFFDRRVKVQVGYAAGSTYREPDTMYLFLNWHFVPKWSVVATAGNKGTSILDVLFQHRY